MDFSSDPKQHDQTLTDHQKKGSGAYRSDRLVGNASDKFHIKQIVGHLDEA